MKNLYLAQRQAALRKLRLTSTGDVPQATARDRQLILMGLMVPTMAIILNLTMFGVALPAIRSSFQIGADVAGWLVTIYSLPFMIAMPLYGRLGDELGKRRLFLIGILTFLAGTIITLSAADLWLMMVGRAVQGLGAASSVPLCIAIISQLFPIHQRGKALGTWNSIGPVTGIMGPFMAGLLVDYLGWRTIFGPVLLVGLGALWVIRHKVPHRGLNPQLAVLRSFDWAGVALLATSVTLLTFYLSSPTITRVATLRDGRLLGLTVLFFALFIGWEKRHSNPYVGLKIFASPTFSRASVGAGVRMFSMSGVGFLMPLYLTDVHLLSASAIGIVLMMHAGALLTTMRAGGQLADRWASRWPVTVGLLVQVGSMVSFSLMPATTPLWLVTAVVMIHGLGAGLSLAALHRASMGRIPQEQVGMAAGVYSMVRFTGTMLGPAVGGVLLQQGLDWSLPVVEAYQLVFWMIAGVAVLGVVAGFGLRE